MGYSASAPALPFLLMLFFHVLPLCFLTDGAAAQKPRYAFMKEATQVGNETEYYDYVVVGGGTAGCALAATLSEGTTAEAASPRRVLLLERGGSPYDNPNVTRAENFHINLMDMSPESPSQMFVSEDGVVNSRARVLGGGSSINAGFYSRASAGYVAAARWDAAVVKAAFQWVEARVAHRPQVRPWQAAVRDALLEVGVGPYNGFTYDHVEGTKLGGTIFDRDGFRHSAADLLSYARPDRLTVLLHATVLGILFRTPPPGPGQKKPTAVGVAYRDAEGGIHQALLEKGGEVILSAGALGSPQLLMISGIGPKEQLQSLGIPVLLDQPHVGIGMADNPMNSFVIPTQRPMQKSLLQVVGITKFGSYIEASSGFGTMPNSIHTSYVYQVGRGNEKKVLKPYPIENFKGGCIVEKIKGPLSKGHLRLKSSSVDETPAVTFNYFRNSRDLRRCVKGIKDIERIIKSKSFRRFLAASAGDRISSSSSATGGLSIAELKNLSAAMATNLRPKHANVTTSRKQFCKDTVTSIWHYHGGCVRGKVVDKDYSVMGVNSLRVVDGSTFSSSPGTNPQATVMMLGRYMGLSILKHRATALLQQQQQPRPKRN